MHRSHLELLLECQQLFNKGYADTSDVATVAYMWCQNAQNNAA